MSRILRRPMFRGGRVDSRGTGITSGLSYEKGGRVGLANGGGYKFSETPIAKGLGYLNNEFNKMLAAGYDLGAVPINTLGRLFGYNPGFSGTKFMNTMTGGDFLRNNPNLDPDIAYLIGQTSAKEGFEIPSMEKQPVMGVGRMGPPGGGETSLGSGKATYKKPKIELPKIDEKDVKLDMEESVDIDKEKFAKLLGSDKARGADITDMLLSFAGKALKPEATVKSAFGEFAEAEAKRPSRRQKVEDAAAQLAINKYIKGEISKAEAETLIKRLELQAKFADERTAKSAAEYIQASDAASFSGRVKEGLNSAYSKEGIVPEFTETDSKTMTEEFEFGPDDVGMIFIEKDTKRVYTYDSKGNQRLIYQG